MLLSEEGIFPLISCFSIWLMDYTTFHSLHFLSFLSFLLIAVNCFPIFTLQSYPPTTTIITIKIATANSHHTLPPKITINSSNKTHAKFINKPLLSACLRTGCSTSCYIRNPYLCSISYYIILHVYLETEWRPFIIVYCWTTDR
jgi:hypothetical protein